MSIGGIGGAGNAPHSGGHRGAADELAKLQHLVQQPPTKSNRAQVLATIERIRTLAENEPDNLRQKIDGGLAQVDIDYCQGNKLSAADDVSKIMSMFS